MKVAAQKCAAIFRINHSDSVKTCLYEVPSYNCTRYPTDRWLPTESGYYVGSRIQPTHQWCSKPYIPQTIRQCCRWWFRSFRHRAYWSVLSMGGSASQNSFQNVGHLMSSRRLIDLLLFCFRPDDHIALTVSDQGDAGWLMEHTFIFQSRVSGSHLQTACTFTQSTQCSG